MYDQQGQGQQPQDNQAPPWQPAPAPTNDGALGVSHDQTNNNTATDNPFPPAQTNQHDQPLVDNDLLSIKQDALKQLSPLIEHLDQSPEEKFKTTMMMIQASDDQALIKNAYETARQITDEKAQAQALLDVVNEINYFTQQNQK